MGRRKSVTLPNKTYKHKVTDFPRKGQTTYFTDRGFKNYKKMKEK